MNTYDWLQTVFFFTMLLLLVKPLGTLHGQGLSGRADPALAPPWPLRESVVPDLRGEQGRGDGLAALCRRHAPLQPGGLCGALRPAALAAPAAPEPAGPAGLFLATGAQHRHQLHHQHQLAGLQRRGGGQLLHPDGGAHGAQLRLRRHRHGHRHRPDPRFCPAQDLAYRQLLGRSEPRHPLHPAAAGAGRRPHPGLPGRDPELQPLPDRALGPGHQL